jgi:hypothetical protein
MNKLRGRSLLGLLLFLCAGISHGQTSNSSAYTPSPGSPERASIMDAIRLATSWNVKFRVNHLMVVRAGSKALAVADVADASGQTEDAGIFQLEGLNSQWRTLYSVGGGGGADDCPDEAKILKKMIAKAQDYSASRDVFPETFWRIVGESKSPDQCMGTVSREY